MTGELEIDTGAEVSALRSKPPPKHPPPPPHPASYGPTGCRSYRLALLCWLVDCTMVSLWFQRSSDSNLPHVISADTSGHQRRGTLEGCCSESTSPSLRCYALACGPNMATAVPAFCAHCFEWRSDWLKLHRELAGRNALCFLCFSSYWLGIRVVGNVKKWFEERM